MTWALHQYNEEVLAKNATNITGTFNLIGCIIGNGITDFNFDGFVPQAFEVYPHYGIIPIS